MPLVLIINLFLNNILFINILEHEQTDNMKPPSPKVADDEELPDLDNE